MKKQKSKYKVVGVMSGTSLDGLDLCLAEYQLSDKGWTFDAIDARTYSYSNSWRDQLKQSMNLSSENLALLSNQFAEYIAKSILSFCDLKTVDLIASHGHTVFHQPKNKLTIQIGNGAIVAAKTGCPCISDFRSLDVALNGQGAPLVPMGDLLLFSEYKVCINLGGFVNVSIKNENAISAYDVCAMNIVLNELSAQLGKDFDEDGKLAQDGNIDDELLKKLNALDYFKLSPPKSLGKEWVNTSVSPILKNSGLKVEDQVATFTLHVAQMINKCLLNYQEDKVLMTGGGAFNKHLISLLNHPHIIIPQKQIVEYKEAIIFGLLGILRWREEINTLSSVTGAYKDSCGGHVFLA